MAAIMSWRVSASSIDGALAAFRQALAEETCGGSDRTLTVALLEMGLAFFDAQPVDNSVDNGEN